MLLLLIARWAFFGPELVERFLNRCEDACNLVRVVALENTFKLGQIGVGEVFEIVKTQTGPVQWAAYDLLWDRVSQEVLTQNQNHGQNLQASETEEITLETLLNYFPLRSEVGVDYTQLSDLLAAGEWQQADAVTRMVASLAADRQEKGWLLTEDMSQFPCFDLHTIDQLWIRYSEGRFGFSVQKQIYESLGGIPTYKAQIFQKFANRLGWQRKGEWLHDSELTFSLAAPSGHLPAIWWIENLWRRRSGGNFKEQHDSMVLLFSRAETCGL